MAIFVSKKFLSASVGPEGRNLELSNCWIKIDQLDVTWFIISLFTAQHVSNVSTSNFRNLRLIVDLFREYAGWSAASACVWIPLHPRRTTPVTPTHIEPEQYNPWDKFTISRKLLKMNVLTFETCWAENSEIIKQMTSSWSIFIELSRRRKVQ